MGALRGGVWVPRRSHVAPVSPESSCHALVLGTEIVQIRFVSAQRPRIVPYEVELTHVIVSKGFHVQPFGGIAELVEPGRLPLPRVDNEMRVSSQSNTK